MANCKLLGKSTAKQKFKRDLVQYETKPYLNVSYWIVRSFHWMTDRPCYWTRRKTAPHISDTWVTRGKVWIVSLFDCTFICFHISTRGWRFLLIQYILAVCYSLFSRTNSTMHNEFSSGDSFVSFWCNFPVCLVSFNSRSDCLVTLS